MRARALCAQYRAAFYNVAQTPDSHLIPSFQLATATPTCYVLLFEQNCIRRREKKHTVEWWMHANNRIEIEIMANECIFHSLNKDYFFNYCNWKRQPERQRRKRKKMHSTMFQRCARPVTESVDTTGCHAGVLLFTVLYFCYYKHKHRPRCTLWILYGFLLPSPLCQMRSISNAHEPNDGFYDQFRRYICFFIYSIIRIKAIVVSGIEVKSVNTYNFF